MGGTVVELCLEKDEKEYGKTTFSSPSVADDGEATTNTGPGVKATHPSDEDCCSDSSVDIDLSEVTSEKDGSIQEHGCNETIVCAPSGTEIYSLTLHDYIDQSAVRVCEKEAFISDKCMIRQTTDVEYVHTCTSKASAPVNGFPAYGSNNRANEWKKEVQETLESNIVQSFIKGHPETMPHYDARDMAKNNKCHTVGEALSHTKINPDLFEHVESGMSGGGEVTAGTRVRDYAAELKTRNLDKKQLERDKLKKADSVQCCDPFQGSDVEDSEPPDGEENKNSAVRGKPVLTESEPSRSVHVSAVIEVSENNGKVSPKRQIYIKRVLETPILGRPSRANEHSGDRGIGTIQWKNVFLLLLMTTGTVCGLTNDPGLLGNQVRHDEVSMYSGGNITMTFTANLTQYNPVLSSYCIHFESKRLCFVRDDRFEIAGLISVSQLNRFSVTSNIQTSVIDISVNLTISNVTAIDQGTYVLRCPLIHNKNGSSFRNVVTIKETALKILVPPGKAKCDIEVEPNAHSHSVHCHALVGSSNTTMTCFQDQRTTLHKDELSYDGIQVRGSFWMDTNIPISCCSHAIETHVGQDSCNDFIWPRIPKSNTPNISDQSDPLSRTGKQNSTPVYSNLFTTHFPRTESSSKSTHAGVNSYKFLFILGVLLVLLS